MNCQGSVDRMLILRQWVPKHLLRLQGLKTYPIKINLIHDYIGHFEIMQSQPNQKVFLVTLIILKKWRFVRTISSKLVASKLNFLEQVYGNVNGVKILRQLSSKLKSSQQMALES